MDIETFKKYKKLKRLHFIEIVETEVNFKRSINCTMLLEGVRTLFNAHLEDLFTIGMGGDKLNPVTYGHDRLKFPKVIQPEIITRDEFGETLELLKGLKRVDTLYIFLSHVEIALTPLRMYQPSSLFYFDDIQFIDADMAHELTRYLINNAIIKTE